MSCRRSDQDAFANDAEARHGLALLEAVCQRATGRTCSAARWTTRASTGSPTSPASRSSPRAWPAILPELRASVASRGRGRASFRYTADNLPIIDRAARASTTSIVAAGHVFGNGAGPTTGRLVADLICGGEPVMDMTPFRADRASLAGRPPGASGKWRPRPRERRIAFINPFGTAAFDAIIEETLVPVRGERHARWTSSTSRACPPTSTTTTRSTSWSWRSSRRSAASRTSGYDAVVVGLLLRPGRPGRPRARRHPGRRAARGGDEPRLVLRPLVHGRHRPSQGACRGWRTSSGSTAPATAAASAPSTGTSPT